VTQINETYDKMADSEDCCQNGETLQSDTNIESGENDIGCESFHDGQVYFLQLKS